jgi:hypothetical protein
MKKLFTLAVLLAALGATSVSAQTWRDDDRRYDDDPRYADNRSYRDARGEYHWQTVERRVWIPERRVRGLFGTRVIPGHYEMRHERIKVYHRQSRRHHMPYGQAKKRWDNDRRDRDRCNDRDHHHDRDGRWYH